MARKRRRVRFAGTTDAHAAGIRRSRDEVVFDARLAMKYIKAGDCVAAANNLVDAATAVGEYRIHKRYSRPGLDLSYGHPVERILNAVHERFVSACAKGRR